jgi:hypothetical protein
MDTTAAVRQGRLRPQCADRYPTLPAGMWTGAERLSELVDSYRCPQRNQKTQVERILPEHDFQFRGGLPRLLGGWFARTRIGELAYCGSG